MVCTRVHDYLRVITNSETVPQEIGLCWRIHNESEWAERSRFDVLSILNVDLRDILKMIAIDCRNVISLRNSNVDEENLEVIESYLDVVHGINYTYDFRALIRVIRPRRPSLLEAVVSVLKQQYGDFGQWHHEVRRRASEWESTRPAINWAALPAP